MHAYGAPGLRRLIAPAAAQAIVAARPILAGVGILENGQHT